MLSLSAVQLRLRPEMSRSARFRTAQALPCRKAEHRNNERESREQTGDADLEPREDGYWLSPRSKIFSS
jgi:hypothetical protein